MNENFIVGVAVNKLFTKSDPELIIGNTCFCATLQDYMKWDYDRLYKESEFLEDGQTSLGNQSSWQMDVLDKSNGYKTLVTWAINDNFGYRFIYSGPDSDHFDYYLKDYKSLLDSVKFTGVGIKETTALTQSTDSKTPSFLTDNNTLDSSTSSITSESTENSDSNSTNTQVNETLKTYENPGFGLTLTHPATWSVEELRDNPDTFSENTIVVIFKTESQGENDKYLENVIINVQGPRSDIKSLASYTRDSTRAFNNMPDINIIKSGKDTLAGFSAHRMEYTSTAIPELDLKKMQVFTVLDNVAYVVTYGAERAEYDRNIVNVEKLIDSIKIDFWRTND